MIGASPFFLTTVPSSCTHGTSTLESPREAAVGEAGDDQLADGRDRSFGAGRRGALDSAPLRRRARSLRSELAVPDAGRAGARAVRGPDELPPPAPLPCDARHAQLRGLLVSTAPRLPAPRPPAGRPDRRRLPRHRCPGGRPGRPQLGRAHRPLPGRDAAREPRAPPGDARGALLRDPAATGGARHLRRRGPLHPAAAPDLRPAQRAPAARRPGGGRARGRALGAPHPPRRAARGRGVPRLPGYRSPARRGTPGARRRFLGARPRIPERAPRSSAEEAGHGTTRNTRAVLRYFEEFRAPAPTAIGRGATGAKLGSRSWPGHRQFGFDAPRPAGICLWSEVDVSLVPIARVLPGPPAGDARRARALLAPRLLRHHLRRPRPTGRRRRTGRIRPHLRGVRLRTRQRWPRGRRDRLRRRGPLRRLARDARRHQRARRRRYRAQSEHSHPLRGGAPGALRRPRRPRQDVPFRGEHPGVPRPLRARRLRLPRRLAPAHAARGATAERQGTELPEDIGKAYAQLLTFLTEVEMIATDVPAKWMGRLNADFFEVKNFIATQAMDEARHAEVFRKRALSTGWGLMRASAHNEFNLKFLRDADSFAEASLALHLQAEGMVLTLFRFSEHISPPEGGKKLFRLVMQDEARHVGYGMQHLKWVVDHFPEKRELIHHHLDEAENFVFGAGYATEVLEPFIILSGKGLKKENIAQGARITLAFQMKQTEEYFERLAKCGLPERRGRSRLWNMFELQKQQLTSLPA